MSHHHFVGKLVGAALLVIGFALPAPVLAVDPPYQPQMERLAEILGSLYFLAPICDHREIDWRDQVAELIALDEPDQDRRSRLVGAFNAGYEAYARSYRTCTPSASAAIELLLSEGETLAREIHARYAE